MLKKSLTGIGIAAVLAVGFVLGNLTLGPIFAQSQATNSSTQSAAIDEQQPKYSGSIQIDDSQYQGVSEADEVAALQSKATISAAQAEAAALATNPGTTVAKTELDNENGVLVYSVELSNGKDVKVDAGTEKVLHTESGELDSQGGSGEQETVED